MKLKKYKLGDLCTFVNGRAYLQPELQNYGKYKIVRVGNLSGGNNSWYYSDMELEPTKYCTKGDLLYAWACNFGPYIWKGDKTIYHYHIWKVINSEQIDKMYLYYLLKFMTNSFMGCVHGSTMLHITKENMESMEVRIHASIEEQRRIATILNKLDCKIELNRQINDNLEAMAKQLYDYWFVQFDFPNEEGKPYKSSGGALVWNEKLKREIPQEWSDCKLKDFINLFDSKRVPLSSKDRGERQGVYPYYGATGIMDYVNDYIFDGDYILLAEDGSTSDAKGFPIVQYIWGKNWVNNHAHIILPKNERSMMFTYQMLRSIPAKQIETGSIQKKISQENLCGYKMVLPNSNLLEKYENVVSPLWEKRKRCIEEINTLTKQRDELLPLLMNGQATVNYHLSDD